MNGIQWNRMYETPSGVIARQLQTAASFLFGLELCEHESCESGHFIHAEKNSYSKLHIKLTRPYKANSFILVFILIFSNLLDKTHFKEASVPLEVAHLLT